MVNKADYVELGLICADVCRTSRAGHRLEEEKWCPDHRQKSADGTKTALAGVTLEASLTRFGTSKAALNESNIPLLWSLGSGTHELKLTSLGENGAARRLRERTRTSIRMSSHLVIARLVRSANRAIRREESHSWLGFTLTWGSDRDLGGEDHQDGNTHNTSSPHVYLPTPAGALPRRDRG